MVIICIFNVYLNINPSKQKMFAFRGRIVSFENTIIVQRHSFQFPGRNGRLCAPYRRRFLKEKTKMGLGIAFSGNGLEVASYKILVFAWLKQTPWRIEHHFVAREIAFRKVTCQNHSKPNIIL